MSSKQKLVYILPEYQTRVGTHLYHNYEFLEVAKKFFDIFVIVEKGEQPKNLAPAYRMIFRFMPLRVIELFFVLFLLRMRGYRTFWTHYSFFGAIIAPFFGSSY
ncbi:MAG: hypothetical protein AAB482_02120, partial [Patescibacteria group bacterium]